MATFNVLVPVAGIVEATSPHEAVNELVRQLEHLGFSIYEGGEFDAFPTDPDDTVEV